MPLSLSAPLDRWLSPAPDPARTAWLGKQPYAHRGLYGYGVPENSREAFDKAIARGHGIELDVQAASGGEAFVFHDAVLDRLTEEHGRLDQRLAYELDRIRLRGSHETIPRLEAVLAQIGGRVPVLIEVKAPSLHIGMLCLSVRRALEGYRGPHAVMSFNPQIGHWFMLHSKRTVRGLVVTESSDDELPSTGLRGRFTRHASLWRAKPDFLAYDIKNLPSGFASAQRARGLPLLTWTVRTREQEQTALAHADEMIYEQPGARG